MKLPKCPLTGMFEEVSKMVFNELRLIFVVKELTYIPVLRMVAVFLGHLLFSIMSNSNLAACTKRQILTWLFLNFCDTKFQRMATDLCH